MRSDDVNMTLTHVLMIPYPSNQQIQGSHKGVTVTFLSYLAQCCFGSEMALTLSTGPQAVESLPMSVIPEEAPRAHARIAYLGPVSPHWEIYADWGDRSLVESFRARALARLVLLTRDDPQFRRNRERVNRDAEREFISLEWDLGISETVG